MSVTFSFEPSLPLTSAKWLKIKQHPLPHPQGCQVLRINMVQSLQGTDLAFWAGFAGFPEL